MEVQRTTEEGRPWQTRFEVQIDLGERLPRRERIILFNSARRCEVYKLLDGNSTFEYHLRDPGSDSDPGP